MWIISLIVFIGGIFTTTIAGIDTSISETNQVILEGSWKPTMEQTKKALKAVQEFLINPDSITKRDKREIKNILANISKYRVQFIGGVSDSGRKIIKCNFFPNSRDKDDFPYWKKDKVEVIDGGFWFWQIEYRIDNGKCRKFSSNGYA